MNSDLEINLQRDLIDSTSQEIRDTSACLIKLRSYFNSLENSTMRTILPYFARGITDPGTESSRLTLDHVMQFLEKLPSHRTQTFNTIVKGVSPDLIQSCSRGSSGRGCKSQITFFGFQGFCNSLLLFRNKKAQLAQRLAARCTQVVLEMQQELKAGINKLRRENLEIKAYLSCLEETQALHTQVIPVVSAYYASIHDSEPSQDFLVEILSSLNSAGLISHRMLPSCGTPISIPYFIKATDSALEQAWEMVSSYKG